MSPVRDAASLRRASGAATQASLRERNLALVMGHVAADAAVRSRADIATQTGLTRSTVSRLVDELIAGGLLVEGEPVTAGLRGRPAVPLAAARGTLVGLGLEVNVWHIAVSVVDLGGAVLAHDEVEGDFVGSEPDAVLESVTRLGAATLDLSRTSHPRIQLAGVTVALPGLMDGGVLLRAPNLGWRGVEPLPVVRRVLGEEGWPVDGEAWASNEADCAALTVADQWEHDDILYVSGEVGIGSSVIIGGDVVTGRHGWAGELGHVCVDDSGPVCGCGSRGCLEVFAGRRALFAAAHVDSLDELLTRLRADDPVVTEAVGRGTHALAIALADALNLMDLSQVILGGHLGQLGPWMIPTIAEELGRRVLSAPFSPTKLTVAAAAEADVATGAALAVVRRIIRNPASWLAVPSA